MGGDGRGCRGERHRLVVNVESETTKEGRRQDEDPPHNRMDSTSPRSHARYMALVLTPARWAAVATERASNWRASSRVSRPRDVRDVGHR